MKDDKKKTFDWCKENIEIVAAIPIFISVVAYIISFARNNWSHDPGDWGTLGDFFNPFIAISNLIVFVIFSRLVYNYNVRKDEELNAFQHTLERPIIVAISKLLPTRNEEWLIKNIGKGAAMNLKIIKLRNRSEQWEPPVAKCYSLSSSDEPIPMDFFSIGLDVICIIYEDIFGSQYVSLAADDETYVRSLNHNFKPIQIKNRKFEKGEFDSILKMESERLPVLRNKRRQQM
jgi:hypothetical protein